MSNQYTSVFTIIQTNIKNVKLNKSQFPIAQNISGSHLGCDFSLDTEQSQLTIQGSSLDLINDCARNIIRSLNRKQDWGFHFHEQLDKSSGMGVGTVNVKIAASVQEGYKDTNELISNICNEYNLPKFLDLLFRESILNCSTSKLEVAFFLIYTALERAVKLLYEYCCGKTDKQPIDHMLKELKTNAEVLLKVNVAKFDNKSLYREIRNAIAHGDPKVNDLKYNLSKTVRILLNDVDNIFRQLSLLLLKYESFL